MRNPTQHGRREFVLEIHLNGKERFDSLLNTIHQELGILYRILNADIEFYGECHLGTIQLLVEADTDEHQNLEYYLNSQRILNTSVENIRRKAV